MHNLCDLRVALLAKIGRNSHLNKVTVNNALATAVAGANALLRLVRKELWELKVRCQWVTSLNVVCLQ